MHRLLFNPTMRVNPSCTIYNPTAGTAWQVRMNVTNYTVNGPYAIGHSSAFIDFNPITRNFVRWHLVPSAEL